MSSSDSLQPRKLPSQDRAKLRVEEILAATRAILLESGIGAVTTASIATRAGVPVGSVYQYFPNKKAIFLELYREYLDRVHSVLERFERNGPYDQGWQVFLERIMAATHRAEFDEDVEGVLLAVSETFPELQEAEERHMDRVVETWVRMLQRLGSRWARAKLGRLVRYMYLLNGATMRYQRQFHPSARERRDWDRAILFAGFGQCLPD